MILNRKSRKDLVEDLNPKSQGAFKSQGNYIRYETIVPNEQSKTRCIYISDQAQLHKMVAVMQAQQCATFDWERV